MIIISFCQTFGKFTNNLHNSRVLRKNNAHYFRQARCNRYATAAVCTELRHSKMEFSRIKKIKFSDYLVGWRIIRTFASRLYPNLTIHGSHKTFGRV